MEHTDKQKLIILGSGPAGLTAALYAARADLQPLVFEGSAPGGQLMGTTEIENFPGFDGTGPELISTIKEQAKKHGAQFVLKRVTAVDFSDPDNLRLTSGQNEYSAHAIILATGASARWLNLGKGEERFWGKGYTACATCDGAFFRNKVVAVVGGGDSAAEEATFLTRFASKVYLIVRRDEMRASKPMQQRVFDNEKIEVIWNQNVTDLHGEKKLTHVTLTETNTKEESKLDIDGLFMAIGHTPNTAFLGDTIETHDNGYIKVTNHTQTNVAGVLSAGDVGDFRYRQAVTAAGSGCMAALDAEHYLVNKGLTEQSVQTW